ncbi:MAG: hypothetical protein ACKOB6_00115, partial [Candidatus Kapaibacterium sp.]
MNNASSMPFRVQPASVHGTLQKHMLVDGFPVVLDLDRSGDGYYSDAVSGRRFVDFFACFASVPLRLYRPDVRPTASLAESGR